MPYVVNVLACTSTTSRIQAGHDRDDDTEKAHPHVEVAMRRDGKDSPGIFPLSNLVMPRGRSSSKELGVGAIGVKAWASESMASSVRVWV